MKFNVIYDSYKLENRKLPVNYHELINKENIAPDFFEFGPTKVYEFEKVYVSPFGVVYKNHQPLPESLSEYNVNINHFPTYLKKRLLRKVRKTNDKCVVVLSPFYNNFYHFTAECLTRLYTVYPQRETIRVIVSKQSPKYVSRYLDLLGFEKRLEIGDDELAYCPSVLVPTQTTKVHKQNPQIINEIVQTLYEKIGNLGDEYSSYNYVYVTRAKAKYRKVVNEKELLDLLFKFDFKVIDFDDLTLAQSIAIMRNSNILVGVHGAGLTNIMFMEKGKAVINLIHEGHHDDSFYNLASVRDHDTVFIQGKAANTDRRGVCFDNFYVDVAKVEQYLNFFLEKF